MYVGEGQDGVGGCVLGFPTSRTAVPVSGSSRGSGSHLKPAALPPRPLGRRMWNQGRSSSLTEPAAGNGEGPGSMDNIRWSEMGIS